MRITLAIDDDVIAALKEVARAERKSLGEVLSSLARLALRLSPSGKVRNGVPLLAVRPDGQRVTSELVRQLAERLE